MYPSYPDYVKKNVHDYYYQRIMDAALVPWKQVGFFQSLTQYVDSKWALDIAEEARKDQFSQDLRDCQVGPQFFSGILDLVQIHKGDILVHISSVRSQFIIVKNS